ncbi:hypothetical protein BKA67DRAFT_696111 [Truncatella angustata]|uniref:Uncharacterized protein n=1 Tax=Truncatella angustata TaxID=152316 RepID=A0A9P8RHQ1_9PEZI|nr:uncharacterized protein BKA67DRAFT_696111 [Truncatella angustata]KAH6646224.1 hypothetical protein BKA67DRAFT_696111 [Truncatella angustata]
MQFHHLLTALSAGLAFAAPAPEEFVAVDAELVAPAACLPASCASFGCCSGNCGYWCRACSIKYTC